ncbi:SIMPL domain-containing protein [Comamonas composti]|uniref:SIMPL domain-containing protein n=1 Tax=Comamonas composti TaxID=408558 RepID=UPI00047B21CC|nr:SIMPL domain-containing protein [Comamonas composti]
MNKLLKSLVRTQLPLTLASCALLVSGVARAQAVEVPANVLQLSADASVEVSQDWLSATLAVMREGRDASAVQAQLQKIVAAALVQAKSAEQAGRMEVSSGNFGVYPRYAKDGKLDGWQGRAEILLQGRDFARITQTASKVQDMPLSGLEFGLSREAREKVESQAQAKAVEQFKQRAESLARNFGFTGYSLREVSVNSSGGGVMPVFRARAVGSMAKFGGAEADALPVEAGKTQVVVNVSGSVQMR